MKKLMVWLKNEESGQGMVEYGLIIGVVAVVLIAALVILRTQIGGIFSGIQAAITAAG
jgi:pilus assembly protein Flp/PilA